MFWVHAQDWLGGSTWSKCFFLRCGIDLKGHSVCANTWLLVLSLPLSATFWSLQLGNTRKNNHHILNNEIGKTCKRCLVSGRTPAERSSISKIRGSQRGCHDTFLGAWWDMCWWNMCRLNCSATWVGHDTLDWDMEVWSNRLGSLQSYTSLHCVSARSKHKWCWDHHVNTRLHHHHLLLCPELSEAVAARWIWEALA